MMTSDSGIKLRTRVPEANTCHRSPLILALLSFGLSSCAPAIRPSQPTSPVTDFPTQIITNLLDQSGSAESTPENPQQPSATWTLTPTLPVFEVSDMGPGQYLFIPIPQETLPETWSIIAVDMEGNAIGTFLPPGPVYAVFPSPNAEEIATLSQVGGLQVGSTDNGLANPMIRLGQTASWAPNSPALAVVINGDIFVLDTVHGDLHLLADCDTIVHYAECDDPAWSPDGTMIIFSSVGGPTLDEPTDGLYVIEPACLETLSLCEASRKGPFPLLESVTWSPDSAMIAGFADNGDIGILEAPQFRNLRTFPIPHRPPGGDYAHYLAWSPDGNWLAYIWSCNVWLLSPETAESHGLYTDCALLSQGGPISWLTVAR